MQTTKLRDLLTLLGKKIIPAIILLCFAGSGYSQSLNLPNYDESRWVHFGFTLAGNYAKFKYQPIAGFYDLDTLKSIRSEGFPGFGLGAVTNFHIHKYFDLRIVFPSLTFAQRNLIYTFDDIQRTVKVESVTLDASVLLKYKTPRHRNQRFYVLTGVRGWYDFASDIAASRSIANPIVALQPVTYGYEIGFGFDYYYSFFKMSPEFKWYTGLNNALVKDDYIYTQSIQTINPRMFTISLYFE